MNAFAMQPGRRGSIEAKRASISQMQPPQAKSPPRDDRDQSMGNSVVVVIRTISENVQQVGGPQCSSHMRWSGGQLAFTEIRTWAEG
jgi:hypothetical protein